MLVCMLIHLCLCVSNSPHTNIPSHACVHEGVWSSWSCIMMTCKLCACVHAYAQLLMVTHSCMKVWKCTDQRTHVYVHLHAHFMAPTSWQQQSCSYTQRLYPLLFLQRLAVIPVDLQRLYPTVITVTCFLCKTSGYNRSWPCIGYTAVIPNGYNRYLFFMVNQITIRSRAVITASTSGCTCLHAFTCAYLCVCLSACLHTFVYV